MTTMTKPLIAAPIDLSERFTLDDLLLDDRVIVDVWAEDETRVFHLGDEAAVEVEREALFDTEERLERGLRRGWGREPEVPEGVTVSRYDGHEEHLYASASALPAHRRQRFSTWREIDSALVAQDA